MTLAERLRELKATRTIVRTPRLPPKTMTEQSFDRVDAKFDQVSVVNKVDYDALMAKLWNGARASSVSSLSPREMRLAASCLFDGRKRLADDASFLHQYLGALRSIRSRIATKRLIHSYCVHFDPGHAGIKQIGAFLDEAMSSAKWRWEWPERHRRHRLFDPIEAPRRLFDLTSENAAPRRELERAGLKGPLLASGLSAHVFLRVLQEIRQRPQTDPRVDDVDRALAWVRDEKGEIYFSAHSGPLADALLLPWTQQEPDHTLREKIQNFLLEQLGDPRVDRSSWIRTDQLSREVMIRWLAQATLEQFLRVVDQVAPGHQWEYRRAFWNAYIEKRVVANAWVAFGSDGAFLARRIAAETADKLMSRFATLGAAGSDQAVLLLRIGDLVIADWSHNGRLGIWRRGNAQAPEFNKDSYTATELRTESDFDIVHRPPDGWQGTTEAYIRRHTGVRLMESDYMPRRRTR
jgi:hypothetical protein